MILMLEFGISLAGTKLMPKLTEIRRNNEYLKYICKIYALDLNFQKNLVIGYLFNMSLAVVILYVLLKKVQ